jgi:hypothetical protein
VVGDGDDVELEIGLDVVEDLDDAGGPVGGEGVDVEVGPAEAIGRSSIPLWLVRSRDRPDREEQPTTGRGDGDHPSKARASAREDVTRSARPIGGETGSARRPTYLPVRHATAAT